MIESRERTLMCLRTVFDKPTFWIKNKHLADKQVGKKIIVRQWNRNVIVINRIPYSKTLFASNTHVFRTSFGTPILSFSQVCL